MDYDAFMAEHDRFMETKVSPLFFKTNLANLHEDSVIIGTFKFARRISKYPIFKDYPIQYVPDQIMQQNDIDL